jgi:flagellar hook-associated protein 1 FlgK
MSLDGALSIAAGGLADINLGLTVISQNLANAATPQYAAESATQQSLSAGGQDFGVEPGIVVRASSPALQAQLAQTTSQNAALQTTSSALANLQPVLGTVGQNDDLGSLLTAVQSAFSTLLNDPSDAAQQQSVVQSASALTEGINNLAQAYGQARQDAQNGLSSEIGQLNAALDTIGSLSRQIVTLKQQGQSTADLENQRDQAENTVSGLVGAQFIAQPDGDVTVMTDGGVQLPTDGTEALSIASATTGPTSFYPGGGLPGIMLGGVDVTAQMTGGSIGANLTLRDQTLPSYQATLDEFSENLSNRFAAQGLTLFSSASGTIPQSTGPATQSGYVGYANSITVNPAVVANPALVRDGTQNIAGSPTGASAFTTNSAGLAGFSTLITRVLTYALGTDVQDGVAQAPIATSGLGPTGTLSTGFASQAALGDYANALTASQAADSANATSEAGDSLAVQTSLQTKLTAQTGVSMDTELGQMVSLQNAYGANAKVVSTVQTMFAEALAMVQ